MIPCLPIRFTQPIAHYCSVPYLRAAARSPTGKAQPEERLWFGILGAGLLPVALFWLAWTAQPSVHWLAPVASGVIFAIGQLGLTLSCFSYFSDT
jgi:ferric-dicitrate binding protein FerR (iron transport regulator)